MAMEAVGGGFMDWIKTQWDKINFEEWSQSLGTSSADALQVAIYFVSGFAVGFLFKKYFKFLLACLLVSFLIIKGLEYYSVYPEANWQALYTAFGFEPNATLGTVINTWVDWAKEHLLILISSIVGFLIGYKLG